MFIDPYEIAHAIRNGISIPTGAGSVKFSAGTSSGVRTDVTFSNANGVSFGLNGAGVITASVAPGGGGLTNIKVSAGTLSALRSDLTFSNSNGITFGLDGAGVITATVATNYQSPGAYLTTAALSQDSSKYAGTGFTSTSTAGTNIVATLNSSGLSMGIPAYLTTSPAGTLSAVKFSAGTLSSNRSDITFSNSGGVSFGLETNGVITASIATTYAGTGFTTATTAGTNIVGTLNTSGLSMGIPAYLTTAATAAGLTNIKVSAGTLSQLRSDITFANSNSVTFGLNTNGVITASFNPDNAIQLSAGTVSTERGDFTFDNSNGVSFGFGTGASAGHLTATVATNYAGIGFSTSTTAGTNIVGTLNTNGLAMGVPAYLTSAVTASSLPRLDQVLDPNTDKIFSMAGNMLQFQWGTGGSFSTNATREGMFELDVQGNVTAEADVVHAHQHGGAPTKLDLFHIEADGANVTGLRLQMSASIAAEVNQPIKFTTEDAGYAIGSVPMILPAGMSNSVANLNANFVQGKASSVLAGTGFTTATTAGTNIVGTLQTNGLSMGVPAYLTVAAGGGGVAISNSQTLFTSGTVAFSAATGGALTIASSAGGQSLIFSVPQTSSIVGSGPVTVSTTGSTVAISVPAISSLSGVGSIAFSTNGSTISAIVPQTSSLVGAGGISISTNGSTITISYSSSNTSAPTLGYFENQPFFPINTTTISASGSVIQLVPFIVPQPISIAYLRIPASFSFVSTSAAGTTANTSFTQNRTYSIAAVIYTNAGGNMSQIQAFTSSLASFVFQTSITAGNTGSQYTMFNNVTYPVSGNYGNYATSVGFTNSSFQASTGNLTLFTGLKWLDIPFKCSIPAGNYWLGIGGSNNTASNAGPALTGASMNPISMYAQSQTNLTFMLQGAASASSVQDQPGLGSFSTNANQLSNATVAMSNISMQASNPKLYFQMIWST